MSLIPKYFKDKWNGVDEKQIAQLPDSFRNAMLYGTEAECRQAISGIRTRERFLGQQLLGQAAIEYLADIRSMLECQ